MGSTLISFGMGTSTKQGPGVVKASSNVASGSAASRKA
jgi:hypothetical protein